MFDLKNYDVSPKQGLTRSKAFDSSIYDSVHAVYTVRLWEGIGQTVGKDDSCDSTCMGHLQVHELFI